MQLTRSQRFFFYLLSSYLVLLLAACVSDGSNAGTTPTTTGNTPTTNASVTSGTTQPGSGVTTAPIPPTQTSCPTADTARAAIMPPLALGNHQNIIYIVNEYQRHTPTFGTLKRYDVSTTSKNEIIKIPNVWISDAQVSADGQWLLFISVTNDQSKLQMIRMDGQGLQTLYCSNSTNSFYDLQWSVNQKLIAFSNGSDIFLLNVQNGSFQRVFHPGNLKNQGIEGYRIETWLDNTHLYLLTQPLDQPAGTLSILDITRGTDQNINDLQQVFQVNPSQSAFCWHNDSSFDGASLFNSQCTGGDPRGNVTQGPSSIVVESASGGSQHTIYNTSTLAITNIRSITNNTLFYIVGNTTGDTSHNGLWKINVNSTGNTFLTPISGNGTTSGLYLNQFTQFPWSNFSRDDSFYSLEQTNGYNESVIDTLYFGSLNGGKLNTFASISDGPDGTQLSIVGWTTM